MEFALYSFLSRLMGNSHIPLKRHGIRDLEVCDVTMDELDRLEREGADVGLDFQIAQFCVTLGISFLISLLASPPPNRVTFDLFMMFIVIGALVGGIFGLRWYKNKGSFARLMQKIRERQIGPVGDEGHQMKPSELALLEPTEPTVQTPKPEPGRS